MPSWRRKGERRRKREGEKEKRKERRTSCKGEGTTIMNPQRRVTRRRIKWIKLVNTKKICRQIAYLINKQIQLGLTGEAKLLQTKLTIHKYICVMLFDYRMARRSNNSLVAKFSPCIQN